MGNAVRDSVKCSGCGYTLPLDHSGPCPECGDHRKTHHVSMSATLRFIGSLRWQHVRTYYEKHPLALTVLTFITVGSPLVGLMLAGWAGVSVGLALSVGGFIIGLYAVTKVREVHDGGSET
jgi:predicted amidophosphoribosyltransferase